VPCHSTAVYPCHCGAPMSPRVCPCLCPYGVPMSVPLWCAQAYAPVVCPCLCPCDVPMPMPLWCAHAYAPVMCPCLCPCGVPHAYAPVVCPCLYHLWCAHAAVVCPYHLWCAPSVALTHPQVHGGAIVSTDHLQLKLPGKHLAHESPATPLPHACASRRKSVMLDRVVHPAVKIFILILLQAATK